MDFRENRWHKLGEQRYWKIPCFNSMHFEPGSFMQHQSATAPLQRVLADVKSAETHHMTILIGTRGTVGCEAWAVETRYIVCSQRHRIMIQTRGTWVALSLSYPATPFQEQIVVFSEVLVGKQEWGYLIRGKSAIAAVSFHLWLIVASLSGRALHSEPWESGFTSMSRWARLLLVTPIIRGSKHKKGGSVKKNREPPLNEEDRTI